MKTDFDLDSVEQWLSSDEFRDLLSDIVKAGSAAARGRAPSVFTNRTGELFASIGDGTSLETDGYHGYIKAAHKAYFVSNDAGRVAEVKPLVKGVMERTGKYRRVPSPLWLESSMDAGSVFLGGDA